MGNSQGSRKWGIPQKEKKCKKKFFSLLKNMFNFQLSISTNNKMLSTLSHYYQKFKSMTVKLAYQLSNYIRNFFIRRTPEDTQQLDVNKQPFKIDTPRKYMGTSLEYKIINTSGSGDYKPDIAQICNNEKFQKLFKDYFNEIGPFAPHVEMCIIFTKYTTGEKVQRWEHTKMDKPITHISQLNDYLCTLNDYYTALIEAYEDCGSDLRYEEIPRLTLRLKKYSPGTGSSYIRLPEQLLNTRGYVNVKNENNECFKYAIVSALHPPPSHSEHPGQYEKYFDEINFSNILFPIHLDKNIFKSFEERNTSLPPINVHCLNEYKDKLPFPYYCSIKEPNAANAINLLYFQNEDKTKSHFVWMKNLSRALSSLTKHNGATFTCVQCYTKFLSREALISHDLKCLLGENPQIRDMPHCKKHETNTSKCSACKYARTLQFSKYKAQQELPVIMICDTEAITQPLNDPSDTNTTVLAEQHGIGYCIYFLVADYYKPYFPDYVDKVIKYTGDNMARHMLDDIKHHTETISNIIQSYDMPMERIMDDSNETDIVYHSGKVCHICNRNITNKNNVVADHCHFSGKFRGYAHMTCNAEYTVKMTAIPAIFHNFRGYDCKMIIEAVKDFPSVYFSPIMENSEKIKCMFMFWGNENSKFSCKFIDSFMHMNVSLDQLVQDLADYKSDTSFTEHIHNADISKLRESFPAVSAHFESDRQFRLILRKGVFFHTIGFQV